MEPTDAEVADLLQALRRGMTDAQRLDLDASMLEMQVAEQQGLVERRLGLESLVWYALALRGETVH